MEWQAWLGWGPSSEIRESPHTPPACSSEGIVGHPTPPSTASDTLFLPLHPLGLAPQLQFYVPNSLSRYLPRHHSFFNLLSLLRIPFPLPFAQHWPSLPRGNLQMSFSSLPQLSRRGIGQSMLILGLQVEPPGLHLKAALRPPVTWSAWPDNCGPI